MLIITSACPDELESFFSFYEGISANCPSISTGCSEKNWGQVQRNRVAISECGCYELGNWFLIDITVSAHSRVRSCHQFQCFLVVIILVVVDISQSSVKSSLSGSSLLSTSVFRPSLGKFPSVKSN